MPKKKEPTGTPVTKESTKSTKVEKPAAAPAAVKSAAESAKPVAAAKPAVETAAKSPEKPAAPAPAKAAEKPAPATAKTAKPAAEKPAKSPAKSTKPAAKTAKPAAGQNAQSMVTVVVAKFDVGHGNNLYIRGEGPGLSWESGVPMENAGNDVWVWTTNEVREGTISFKFLVNDEGWSTGDNMTALAGETTTLYPSF